MRADTRTLHLDDANQKKAAQLFQDYANLKDFKLYVECWNLLRLLEQVEISHFQAKMIERRSQLDTRYIDDIYIYIDDQFDSICIYLSSSDLVVYSTQDRPFFCWDCCVVTIEAPEIVEDGRGRTRRGVACLLEELSLGGPGPASASLRMCLTS